MTFPRFPQLTPLSVLSRNADLVEIFGITEVGYCFTGWWSEEAGWRYRDSIGDRLFGHGTTITAAGTTDGRDWVGRRADAEGDQVDLYYKGVDLFAVGSDRKSISLAFWEDDVAWPAAWSSLAGGEFLQGTPLAFARRVWALGGWRIRLFGVGTDNRVWEARGYNDDDSDERHLQWEGWSPIGQLAFVQPTTIAAITDSPEDGFIGVFAHNPDGHVHWARWNEGRPLTLAGDLGTWSDWVAIGGGRFGPGTPVTAATTFVQGDMDDIWIPHVFAVGESGGVYHSYAPSVRLSTSRAFEDWAPIGGLHPRFPQQAPISWTCFPGSDEIRLYAIAEDGLTYTITGPFPAEDGAPGDHQWIRIGDGNFTPRTPISAVVRAGNKIDLYAVGTDGNLYTLWWTSGAGWVGWQPVAGTRVE